MQPTAQAVGTVDKKTAARRAQEKDSVLLVAVKRWKETPMKKTIIALILCLTTVPVWSQARPYPGPDRPSSTNTISTS